MPQHVRDIQQHYWRHERLPHLELRSTYQSAQGYKAHSHPELSIGAIISGQTLLAFGEETQRLEAGDLVLIEPERVHACNPVDGRRRSYHMLYVDSQWCLETLSNLYAAPVKRLYSERPLIQQAELFGLFVKMAKQLESDQLAAANLTFNHLVFHVLTTWCSPRKAEPEKHQLAHRIRRRLLDDLVQPPDLDSLAAQFGRSKETVIRIFSKRFGITPKSFVNNARIEKAKLYLRAGQPIVDVSAAVGFSDQSQFHRAFVRYTASTPRQYQQAQSIIDNKS